jgi:ABC-type multidrug transport system ATPase subunit
MSLLSLEGVTKRSRHGRLERTVLKDVSLEVHPGELVAVWGTRRSGRTTLLRVAAGVLPPDEGIVRFDGVDLAARRSRILGREIAYCRTGFSSTDGRLVAEHVQAGLLARGCSSSMARRQAQDMLARTGAGDCAELPPHELDAGESMRVALACALSAKPRLLSVDEPTSGVDLTERDPILELLRSIAQEGIAVLLSTGDATCLTGVDRPLTIDDGMLRGPVKAPEAAVIPLRRGSTTASG